MSKLIIKAKELFDGKGKQIDKYIVVEDDKIVDILDKSDRFDYEGFVTPAIIDAHTHIGMDRDGEPYQEGETNDDSDQIQPLINPVNSIYLDDRAFVDAVDFGVLYSCIVPGSGNLLGGKAMIIKHYAKFTDEVVVKHYGYKMALGYNPRSTTMWKGTRPNTRMGVYALLEKKFDDVLLKKAKADLVKDKKLKELDKKIKDDKDKKLTADDINYEKEIIEKEYALGIFP